LRDKNVVASFEHRSEIDPAGLDPGGLDPEGLSPEGLGAQGLNHEGIKLSAEEKPVLDAKAGQGLVRAVVAQGVMAVLATVIAWLVAGPAAGLSALAGAGAYFIPNSLFALRLLLNAHRPGGANPFTFFLGEAFKLGMTVLLLALVVYFGRGEIVWPAMLIGLLCVLKGYVLLLLAGKLS
jgi:ATP synthase protein I